MNIIDLSTLLQSELTKASHVLGQASLFKHIITPEFDCTTLPGPDTDGNCLPEDLKRSLFYYIHQFDAEEGGINDFPCIYAFELLDASEGKAKLDRFKIQQQIDFGRKLPALKSKTRFRNSNYLYVGKAQQHVGNRMMTHLGYYQSNGNHGLQLAFWLREFQPAVKLRIHVFRFSIEFKDYLSAFEVIMAKQLNPIIGRH